MKKDKILFTILHIFVIFFVLFLKTVVVFPNETAEIKFLEILLMMNMWKLVLRRF